MTIFKLVDRETGEESVEFESQMVFQRACDYCQHLKVRLCTPSVLLSPSVPATTRVEHRAKEDK